MPDIFSSFSIVTVLTAFVPVLLGIILHEVAHGWVASLRGDQTARMLGRLTLNPLPHIDPLGLGVFVLTAATSPVVFGWAKPVPVNSRNLHNPRQDMMLISLAGPLSNMLLAILFAVALRILLLMPEEVFLGSTTVQFFFAMFQVGIMANFSLAWLNLMPIPPLDGGHIVEGLLPQGLAWHYARLQRWGFVVLIVLLATGLLGRILWPLIRYSTTAALWLVGLS